MYASLPWLRSSRPVVGASPIRMGLAFRQVYSALMTKVRLGALVVAVMSTSLVTAVSARADASSDFLAKLTAEGISVGDTPADVQLTLTTALDMCEMLHFEIPPTAVARQVHYALPYVTPEQGTDFIEAARSSKLCAAIYSPVDPAGGY